MKHRFEGKKHTDRFMEPEEFRKLMDAAEGDTVAELCFIAMGLAGLRTIEVTWLTCGSLDRQQKGLWVKTAKRKDNYTGFVALDDESFERFSKAAGRRAEGAPLIVDGNAGVTRRRIRTLFACYREKAKIRHVLSCHSLRHLAGIIRTEAGAQPQEVAQFLRHKNLAQVLVYAQLRTSRNRDMATAAAGALLKKRK